MSIVPLVSICKTSTNFNHHYYHFNLFRYTLSGSAFRQEIVLMIKSILFINHNHRHRPERITGVHTVMGETFPEHSLLTKRH